MATIEAMLKSARRLSSVKRADPWRELQEQLRTATGGQNNTRLLRQILGAATGGVGLGLGVGGAYSLFQQAQRNLRKPLPSATAPVVVDVPVPVEQRQKAAVAEELAEAVEKATSQPGFVDDTLIPFFKGELANSATGDPRWWLTVPPTLAAGFYGGNKLQQWLHAKRRKKEMATELDYTKNEFMSALSPKLAEQEGTLANDLDRLFDVVQEKAGAAREKAAEDPWWYDPDTYGNAVGAIMLTSLLTGGLGAFGGYQHGKKFQRRRLLEEAQKQRRRQRFSKQPGTIIAQPLSKPVPPAIDGGNKFQAAPSLNETENQFA